MSLFRIALPIALAAGIAAPTMVAAQAPAASPKQFVMKAGASDAFEISEGKLMLGSTSDGIRQFANTMITDHTKSIDMVKTAAQQDGVPVTPPVLTAKQKSDLSKLKAASGKARDALYLKQQKVAHQEALTLMQGYASAGTATNLKAAAAQIAPVVQQHLDMLNQMPAM